MSIFLAPVMRLLYSLFGIARYRVDVMDPKQRADSMEALLKLLSKSRISVKISVGRLNHNVFEDSRMIEMFKDLAARDVGIEIVYGAKQIDPETRGLFDLATEGKLELYRLPAEASPHFWVVDGRMVVDEVPQGVSDREFSSQEKLFYINRNAPLLAKRLEQEFAVRKNRAIDMTTPN